MTYTFTVTLPGDLQAKVYCGFEVGMLADGITGYIKRIEDMAGNPLALDYDDYIYEHYEEEFKKLEEKYHYDHHPYDALRGDN